MSTQLLAMKQEGGRQALGKVSDSYRTPPWLINWLSSIYDFEFDICASEENRLFDNFYSEKNSYEGKDWSELGKLGFCNPPFSRGSKELALSEAYRNMVDNDVSSVFIIPSDVSNSFWYSHIIGRATKITVICGRIAFYHPVTNKETSKGIGCAVVEFDKDKHPVFSVDHFIERDDIKSRFE